MHRAAAEAMSLAPDAVPTEVVVVGGTATNLIRLVTDEKQPSMLTAKGIEEALVAVLVGRAAKVAARHKLRLERTRVLPAGAAIMTAILERYRVSELTISESGIREGLVIALAHAGSGWRDALPSLVHGWRD
jgi:exopolyphosphatase/pppGpp-phosphohydrolase